MTSRLQFSLRTSLVLMLIAGVFVGANVVPYENKIEQGIVKRIGDHGGVLYRYQHQGWPAEYLAYMDNSELYDYRWYYGALVLNIGVLLFTIGGTWALLERPWRSRQHHWARGVHCDQPGMPGRRPNHGQDQRGPRQESRRNRGRGRASLGTSRGTRRR